MAYIIIYMDFWTENFQFKFAFFADYLKIYFLVDAKEKYCKETS